MSTARAGAQGHPPTVKIEPVKNPHEEIYKRCYETDEYRIYSPGEKLVPKFWQAANPLKTQSLIDWGCGTGRASLRLKQRGLSVTMVDFVENSLDESVRKAMDDNLLFVKADLTKPLPEDFPKAHFGLCADMLEHIPEEDVDQVIENILSHSKNVYFQIHCLEDHFGEHPHIKGDSEEKVHLHLTQHPYSWWLNKFAEHGVVILASEDNFVHCNFYVTAHRSTYFDPTLGVLNVEEDKIIENIKAAAKTGLPQIGPMETQDEEVLFLAGGPSLNDFEDEIIQERAAGKKLVTVNGTYQWALDRGLKPSLQIIIDAREFNERFTKQTELTEDTKYLICSAADPSVFKNLPRDRTFIFHTALEERTMRIIESEFPNAFPVPGGCTVTLRGLAALRLLGFYKFHIYGMDSCILNGDHHAYKQPENDEDLNRATEVTVAGGTKYEKKFLVTPWHWAQALDFRAAAPRLFNDCLLNIKGDGLIAHMVKAAAELNEMPAPPDPSEKPGAIIYALRPVEDVPGYDIDDSMS